VLLCPLLLGEEPAALAAHIGGATRPEHFAPLVAMVAELPPTVRDQLITRLGRMHMPGCLPLLERLLPSANETQAAFIIDACSNTRHGNAVPVLLAATSDPRGAVREAAWNAMQWSPFVTDHRGDATLREFLLRCLADAAHPHRLAAAVVLYETGYGAERDQAAEVILAQEHHSERSEWIRRDFFARRGDARLFPVVLGDLRRHFDDIGHNAQVNATMQIGEALRAGAVLDDETRRVLLHTIRVCPRDEPASFAARALRDCRDHASYPVLLELLGHSQADKEIVEALCAIDPVRALADWRHVLHTAEELRLFSAILYGTAHTALHPALSDLLAHSPMDLDEATRVRRHDALSRMFWSRWPSVEQDSDPAPHLAFLAAHLQDGDPGVVRQAVRWWSLQTTTDLAADLITRVRAWADRGSAQEREDAVLVMCRRPTQFTAELAELIRSVDTWPAQLWLLRTCSTHGGIITAAELIERIFAAPLRRTMLLLEIRHRQMTKPAAHTFENGVGVADVIFSDDGRIEVAFRG